MKLSDIIDVEKLEKHIANKDISKRKHPTLPIYILNYTTQCQYAANWTPETILARGLIVDEYDNIIGRSFKKFFPPEQHDALALPQYPWGKPHTITEKMDGVLFIVTTYNGILVTATRGSFESDYVPVGNTILAKKYGDFKFDPTKTYVFELISPETRIVVNYGDRRDLVLLSVIDTETGAESLDDVLALSTTFPVPRVYPSSTPADKIDTLFPDDGTTEGVVVHFADGQRAKYKGTEYKRWHRIMTNTNTLTIWEYLAVAGVRKDYADNARFVAQAIRLDPKEVEAMLTHNDLFEAILDRTPDEWYDFVDKTRKILTEQFDVILRQSFKQYAKIEHIRDRKSKAIAISKMENPYKNICMQMMIYKPYNHIIWREIRPKYGKPFVTDEK